MGQVPLSDRQRIGKRLMVWTLGLAVLFSSPGISLAQRPPISVAAYCECTCWYTGGSVQATFIADGSCSTYDRRTWTCKDKAGRSHKGELRACKRATGVLQGEPPATVPPGGARPPAGTLQKSP